MTLLQGESIKATYQSLCIGHHKTSISGALATPERGVQGARDRGVTVTACAQTQVSVCVSMTLAHTHFTRTHEKQ